MKKMFVCTFAILCLSANITAQTTKMFVKNVKRCVKRPRVS